VTVAEHEQAATTLALEEVQAALGERYTVDKALGEGGMAMVYLAEDRKHHRKVAVKVLRPELSATIAAERFLLEIETAAKLTHPNILPVHDSGQADGVLYYVMPLVEGETLQDRLQSGGRFPVDEALRLTREVAEALAFAHQQGIVHRDIKPGNILLQAGHALVADFGIARALERGGAALTQIGYSVGTPQYMSPEQALGEQNIDGRADIYSMGCVLYEMLSGGPAFEGPTAQAVLSKNITEDPPPLNTKLPDVPVVLERVVKRAMAKDPADRYQNANELADALILVDMNVLTEGVRGAMQVPPVSVAPRKSAVSPTQVAVISGVSTAAALAAAYAVMQQMGLPPWVFAVLVGAFGVCLPIGRLVYLRFKTRDQD
jgi:serine/threonine-protein kinase